MPETKTQSIDADAVGGDSTKSAGASAIEGVIGDVNKKADSLERESHGMRSRQQASTVATIILGVSAPAIVTYSAPAEWWWWKILAIVITALGTASATIRTVLRYNERYSNSALAAIALRGVAAQLRGKREDVRISVKDEFREQKLFEFSVWGRQQEYEISKSYVERDVAASKQDQIKLGEVPVIDDAHRIDPTRKPVYASS